MEARVHKNLSTFLQQHSLQDAISNIDDIVLSYLLGVLDLIGQGEVEDCFDLEDVTDMMNAYLPGFDSIDRSAVMDWMFNLAARLKNPEKSAECALENGSVSKEDAGVDNKEEASQKKESSFPRYDYDCPRETSKVQTGKQKCNDDTQEKSQTKFGNTISEAKTGYSVPSLISDDVNVNKTASECLSGPPIFAHSHSKEDKEQKSYSYKRKKRYLSCSSQESQDDSSKVEISAELDKCLVQHLLDMFPNACSMEATQCLHLSNGDLNVAAQLIIDRQESGQAISSSQVESVKNSRKSKKVSESKLDDNSIKSSLIEKYSFYDVAEDERTHKPPPLKNEAKKLVRYRDGQIVSMKGERFSEIKKTT